MNYLNKISEYLREDDGGSSFGGGAASASELGKSPTVSFGGSGIGFSGRKKKTLTNEDVALINIVNSLYEEVSKKTEPCCTVTWTNNRRVYPFHPKQKTLGGGIFYVKFNKETEAKDFYLSLRDMGVDVKLDVHGK